jgi:hypothetical protein
MKFIRVAPDRYINTATIKEIVLTSSGMTHPPMPRPSDDTWSAMVIYIDGKREPFVGPPALNLKNFLLAQ